MKRNYGNIIGPAAAAVLLALALGCSKKSELKLERVKTDKNVMVVMSDGVELATDIYYPPGLDKAPTILVRTPYGKSLQMVMGKTNFGKYYAKRGYVVVVQDVRGREKSGGDFYPFIHDGKDGMETMDWIRSQPWFNGKLGTYGPSYLGTTQWFAAPGQDIDCMYLSVTSPNLKRVIYRGGQFNLLTVYNWAVMMGDHKANFGVMAKMSRFDDYMRTLPLDKADDKAGADVSYFNDALDVDKIFDLYDKVNFEDKYDDVRAPAVSLGGWYDMFIGPQLEDFQRLREQDGPASKSVLIVGPWGHGMGGDGSVDYGDVGGMGNILGSEQAGQWMDYWLKGEDAGVEKWPPVKIFVMGENVWREEEEWPLARARYTKYYLHSGGSANSRDGDGVLSAQPPAADEAPDSFSYDPMDPVPTKGGNNLITNLGAHDQAKIEDRDDVLCYTTPELETDLEVTGPISAVIYAASDAKDTDFTVKLVDVHPDGKAINIQDGVVRAMYRDNDPAAPTPLTPGEVEEYRVDLWATSNLFKAGHRIRVEVSSSNFPRYNRNLNTGESPVGAVDHVVANQTIHHDAESPSHVLLPIIPR